MEQTGTTRRKVQRKPETMATQQDEDFQMPEKYTKKLEGKKKVPAKPFPLKLMEILSYKCYNNVNYTDIITWLPDGKSFKIIHPKEFTTKVVPQHLKKAKYSTFQRKMTCWGFQRLINTHNHSSDQVEGVVAKCFGYPTTFFHPYFQRNRTDLLDNIQFSKNPIGKNSNSSSIPCPVTTRITSKRTSSSYTTPIPKKQKIVLSSNETAKGEAQSSVSHKPASHLESNGPKSLQQQPSLSSTIRISQSSKSNCSTRKYSALPCTHDKINLPPRKRPILLTSLITKTSPPQVTPYNNVSQEKSAFSAPDTTTTNVPASLSPVVSKPKYRYDETNAISTLTSRRVPAHVVSNHEPRPCRRLLLEDYIPTTFIPSSRSQNAKIMASYLLSNKAQEHPSDDVLLTRKASSSLLALLKQQSLELQKELEMLIRERDHYKRLLVEQWLP
mmetsp:Transcript_23901/g.33541  ORF Transcript_23901/g.33541 Transcript_23901/m.33541 type:complete len:442 (+) Transcript_23901:220-1545(+)